MKTPPNIKAALESLVDPDLRKELEAHDIKVTVNLEGSGSEAKRRALESAVAKRKHDQDRAQRLALLGTTGAGLVHEARNLLTAVKGFAQSGQRHLGSEADTARLEKCLNRIVEESNRAAELLNSFLAFARNRPRTLDIFDVRDAIKRAEQMTRHQVQLHGIKLNVASPEEEIKVVGSADELARLLLNLILNAQQVMESGGEISVGCEPHDSTVRITVTDTGPGIPESLQPTIFDPFVSTKSSGTGLGLAICRRIADDHEGTLELESSAGNGATFVLTLPRVQLKRNQ